MGLLMTRSTQCDQILLGIVALEAARLNVMDLKIFSSAAILASPSVPVENSSVEFLVGSSIESQPWVFGYAKVHERHLEAN